MNNKIKIKISGKILEAELNQTGTASKIIDVLPLIAEINHWGGEIYFKIPVKAELENETEILGEGSLAFWPPGNAFCIFFGPTPASTDSRPRATSPVTLIGKLSNASDFDILKGSSDGQRITITK